MMVNPYTPGVDDGIIDSVEDGDTIYFYDAEDAENEGSDAWISAKAVLHPEDCR